MIINSVDLEDQQRIVFLNKSGKMLKQIYAINQSVLKYKYNLSFNRIVSFFG